MSATSLATGAVTADYVHRDKRASPRETITVGKALVAPAFSR